VEVGLRAEARVRDQGIKNPEQLKNTVSIKNRI